MQCEICGVKIIKAFRRVLPGKKFREALEKGFDPFKHPKINISENIRTTMAFSSVKGGSDAYQEWIKRAKSRSSDWGICSECYYAISDWMKSAGIKLSPIHWKTVIGLAGTVIGLAALFWLIGLIRTCAIQ